MPTNTRKAFRRDLAFDSLEQLEVELDRVRRAQHEGTLRTSGNWSAGQALGHLAKWMGWYLDGRFPFTALMLLRVAGKALRKKIIQTPFKPGLKFKPKTGDLGGDPDYSFEEGWDRLQNQLDRLRAGESLACDTPLVGPVTHEEGLRIQLHHFALHLSFLHPDGPPPEDRV
ncbi:MAG: DUF1569 domain-containing protein [Planctomycetota bacterium]